MDLDGAHKFLVDKLSYDTGKFLLPDASDELGAGKLYSGIRFPVFNESDNTFNTLEGVVYVLTHECDVDQNNNRAFNEDVLICPLTPLEKVIEMLVDANLADINNNQKQYLLGFLGNLGKREISRLIYFPQIQPILPYGAVLYLNQITNTSVTSFGLPAANKIASITAYGLNIVDQTIQNHLLRPKSQILPLTWGY